jgi:hypothetical protein
MHYQIAFYKAPIEEIIRANGKVLVDLREIELILEDKGDEADSWRKQAHGVLSANGVQVLSWEKEEESLNFFVSGLAKRNLPRGHSSRVRRMDSFSAMAATFMPMSFSPFAVAAVEEQDKGKAYWDWRGSVPEGLNPSFTHVSVLSGCGCRLLFSSQYATFLPDWPFKDDIRNVRVASMWQPSNLKQMDRCGWSTGLWLSSAPLTFLAPRSVPIPFSKKGDLPCVLGAATELAKPVAGSTVDDIFVAELFNGITATEFWYTKRNPDDLLGQIVLPKVLDQEGYANDGQYVLFRGPKKVPEERTRRRAKKQQVAPTVDALEDLKSGGPVDDLISGARDVLCKNDVAVTYTFSDDELPVAISGSVQSSGITFPTGENLPVAKLGMHKLFTAKLEKIMGATDNVHKDLPAAHRMTLQSLEEKLGGPIPVISSQYDAQHDKGALPEYLKTVTDTQHEGNLDWSWWIVFSLCPRNKAGYAYADNTTGTLRADCDDEPLLRPGGARVGPTRAVMLRINFDHSPQGVWKEKNAEANAVAMRDGFVLFTPAGHTSYESTKEWPCSNPFTWNRHLYIQAYVQLDPRIKEKREDVCGSTAFGL